MISHREEEGNLQDAVVAGKVRRKFPLHRVHLGVCTSGFCTPWEGVVLHHVPLLTVVLNPAQQSNSSFLKMLHALEQDGTQSKG